MPERYNRNENIFFFSQIITQITITTERRRIFSYHHQKFKPVCYSKQKVNNFLLDNNVDNDLLSLLLLLLVIN